MIIYLSSYWGPPISQFTPNMNVQVNICQRLNHLTEATTKSGSPSCVGAAKNSLSLAEKSELPQAFVLFEF